MSAEWMFLLGFVSAYMICKIEMAIKLGRVNVKSLNDITESD